MRPQERWLDARDPDEAELRRALLDAREGPSAAQVDGVARRVAERATTLEALRRVPRARLAWQISAGVGLSILLGALLWPKREREPRPSVDLPTGEAAPHMQIAAAPAPPVAPPAAETDSRQHPAATLVPERKPRVRRRSPMARDVALADEVLLLQEARRALLAHPDTALELAHKHRDQFARGAFVEERASIEIEALWRIARFREARKAWGHFARTYPHSAYRQRLERLWSEAPQQL